LKSASACTSHPFTKKDKRHKLGVMAGNRRQIHLRKQLLLDDLMEWTELKLPEPVRLAKDRNAYRKFVDGIAYAR